MRNGGTIWLAPDLKENLAKSDKFEADFVKMMDDYIAMTGLDGPGRDLAELREGMRWKRSAS